MLYIYIYLYISYIVIYLLYIFICLCYLLLLCFILFYIFLENKLEDLLILDINVFICTKKLTIIINDRY